MGLLRRLDAIRKMIVVIIASQRRLFCHHKFNDSWGAIRGRFSAPLEEATMFRFTRFLIFLSIVLLAVFTVARAQTPQRDNRPRTASVSGRVTIAGKPAVNAKVVITEVNDRPAPAGNQGFSIELPGSGAGEDYVVLTDAEGRYRVTNLPEDKYEAQVSLRGCVNERPSISRSCAAASSPGA